MMEEKILTVEEVLKRVRKASSQLAGLSDSVRNRALLAIGRAIEDAREIILEANIKDLEKASALFDKGEMSEASLQRLKLTHSKLNDIIQGINDVASLPDPVGQITRAIELDKDLELYRVTAPIGVVAVVFESRPDALPQIVSLCLKTSNVVILKGGKEAENTLKALFDCINYQAIKEGIPEHAINILSTREDFQTLLSADQYVDLVIPRGSNALVKHIQENTRIPVLGHADGICHLYIHDDADIEKAIKLTLDSKTQYPSACNSIETLLIHNQIMPRLLPEILFELQERNVELRLDESSSRFVKESGLELEIDFEPASEEDWKTEYCDLILSIKIVNSLEEAIEHINSYGSGHTDCMVSQSKNDFETFFKGVDSAGVFLNSSTRFADGFRYGFGAEVGIATGKLHPRGPVGLEGLVTYKYRLEGEGHLVEDYSGDRPRKFTHRLIDKG